MSENEVTMRNTDDNSEHPTVIKSSKRRQTSESQMEVRGYFIKYIYLM